MATVFMSALDRAAEIMASTEDIGTEYLEPKCREHLMKMNFCQACISADSDSKVAAKPCYGYCTNVLR